MHTTVQTSRTLLKTHFTSGCTDIESLKTVDTFIWNGENTTRDTAKRMAFITGLSGHFTDHRGEKNGMFNLCQLIKPNRSPSVEINMADTICMNFCRRHLLIA